MMLGTIGLCGVLMFCQICVDGQQLTSGQPQTCGSVRQTSRFLYSTAVFLCEGDGDGTAGAGDRLPDDIVAALRGRLGEGGELANQSLTQFGICADPGDPTESLLEFVKGTSERNRLQILHPTAGKTLQTQCFEDAFSPQSLLSMPAPVSEDAQSGSLRLTFDLPPSAPPALTPLLVLAFESRPAAGNLRVTFSSRSLQPDKQVVNNIPMPPKQLQMIPAIT